MGTGITDVIGGPHAQLDFYKFIPTVAGSM
jgi:hypothetical protein